MTRAAIPHLTVPQKFLRMCRRRMRSAKLADSTGVELTGGRSADADAGWCAGCCAAKCWRDDEQQVGVLLPPTVAGVVVNAALAIDRRVAVNLNYTVSSEVMNDCIAQCGIRHVLTSRRVMERFKLKLDAEVVYLEDFVGRITLADKLVAAAAAWLAPAGLAGTPARTRYASATTIC